MINASAKVVIFDIDNVILKSFDDNGQYLFGKAIEQDIGISLDVIQHIFSDDDPVFRGQMSLREKISESFKTLNITHITPEAFITYWLDNDIHIDHQMLAFAKTFKERNFPCYLATNQEQLRMDRINQHIGIHFHGYYASYQVGYRKPQPEFYQHVFSDLIKKHGANLKPEDIFFIDDILANVESARACGWHAYHYQNDLQMLQQVMQNQYSIQHGVR